jgi:hypothetical protein
MQFTNFREYVLFMTYLEVKSLLILDITLMRSLFMLKMQHF